MNQDQPMDYAAKRRAILRISVVDAAFSLAWLGLALWTGLGSHDDRTFYSVLGVICGMVTLLVLWEPSITGASRQQLRWIRPQLRPRWFYFVYIFIFAVCAVVTFPLFEQEIGHKVKIITVILSIMGAIGLSQSIFNLLKFSLFHSQQTISSEPMIMNRE